MPDPSYATVDILALHDRARNRERTERICSAAAGFALSSAAASFRGRHTITRLILGTAGGLLLAHGLSGLSIPQVKRYVQKLFKRRLDLEKRFHDGTHDIVDAASFDSFPASDPPSYSPGVG